MSLPRLTNENPRKDLIQINYCEISIREGAFFIAFFQRGGGAVGYKQKHPYIMQLLCIFRFMTHGRRCSNYLDKDNLEEYNARLDMKQPIITVLDRLTEKVQNDNKIQPIKNSTIRELCGFTKQQARATVDKMIAENMIFKVGAGSATEYNLK